MRSLPMPGFLEASERRKYVRGPGAAGKFGGGLRSVYKISYLVLPPGGPLMFPTLWSPRTGKGPASWMMHSWEMPGQASKVVWMPLLPVGLPCCL